MKQRELLKIEGLELITKNGDLDKEVSDLYTCDLLSWAMGHIKGEDVLLLTVLNSINVVAVATLLDLAGIVFCEGVEPTEDILAKAEEEKINLYKSNKTTFHTALEIKNESLL